MKNFIEYTAEPHTPYPNNYISRNKLKKKNKNPDQKLGRMWNKRNIFGRYTHSSSLQRAYIFVRFGDYISKDPAIIPLSVQVLKRQMSGKMYKKIHHSIQKVNGKTGSF